MGGGSSVAAAQRDALDTTGAASRRSVLLGARDAPREQHVARKRQPEAAHGFGACGSQAQRAAVVACGVNAAAIREHACGRNRRRASRICRVHERQEDRHLVGHARARDRELVVDNVGRGWEE